MADVKVKSVEIGCEGRKLHGTCFAPADALTLEPPLKRLPGLLFVHGLSSDQTGYRERATAVARELRTISLTFDLSGHGVHDSVEDLESITPQDHLADVLAACRRLANHPAVDPNRIGVCGASYGGYLSALATRYAAIKKLLLRAPAIYSDDDFTRPFREPRRGQADWTQGVLIESLKMFTGELLVLQSEKDEVIPRTVMDAYLAASRNARLASIPDATHVLVRPEWKERFLREIASFFSDL